MTLESILLIHNGGRLTFLTGVLVGLHGHENSSTLKTSSIRPMVQIDPLSDKGLRFPFRQGVIHVYLGSFSGYEAKSCPPRICNGRVKETNVHQQCHNVLSFLSRSNGACASRAVERQRNRRNRTESQAENDRWKADMPRWWLLRNKWKTKEME